MGKPELLWNNFGIWDFNERHVWNFNENTSASQWTQVRWIDGFYLMIYAYKTQDIASCKPWPVTPWYNTMDQTKLIVSSPEEESIST